MSTVTSTFRGKAVVEASGTPTIYNTAVALPATALAGRRRAFIQNLGSNDIYVGDATVTTALGMRVAKGATLSMEIGQNVDVYAIASSGATRACLNSWWGRPNA